VIEICKWYLLLLIAKLFFYKIKLLSSLKNVQIKIYGFSKSTEGDFEVYVQQLKDNIKFGILQLHFSDGSSHHQFGNRAQEVHWHINDER
jgi:hypothetical protein